MTSLPTQRLSPKNQVTLPRDARAFLGLGEGALVCGLTHKVRKESDGELFPYLLLMTDVELQRREAGILGDQTITPAKRFELVTKLNGSVRRMAVDAQHRIVLPPHFVAHCTLERDVFLVSTNSTVQAWNPNHYLRWSGLDQTDHFDPELDAYLTI